LQTQNNENVQELFGYANSWVTLDLYAQFGRPEKRQAQSRLAQFVTRRDGALRLSSPSIPMIWKAPGL